MNDAFFRRDENFSAALPLLVACAAAYVEPSLLEDETCEYFKMVIRSVLLASVPGFGGTRYGTKTIAQKFALLLWFSKQDGPSVSGPQARRCKNGREQTTSWSPPSQLPYCDQAQSLILAVG